MEKRGSNFNLWAPKSRKRVRVREHTERDIQSMNFYQFFPQEVETKQPLLMSPHIFLVHTSFKILTSHRIYCSTLHVYCNF